MSLLATEHDESCWTFLSGLLRDAAEALRAARRKAEVVDTIESARSPLLACPACQCTRLYRNGHANDLQRFKCTACRRTFNSLTGTPLARLRLKGKWLEYCRTVLDPTTTVRRAAQSLKVHRTTSFRWRHRMLHLPKHDRQLPLQGVVEVATVVVRESLKGNHRLTRPPYRRGATAGAGSDTPTVAALVARARSGSTFDTILGKSCVTATVLEQQLAPVLGPAVLLVTEPAVVYTAFALQANIRHAVANLVAQELPQAAIHLHNVQAYISRMNDWLGHFHGVATRYLDNYLGWHWAIDRQRISRPQQLLRRAVGHFLS
jgi:transposase-like protein